MVDVRGDVLRPPHGTTPAAVNLILYFVKLIMYTNVYFLLYVKDWSVVSISKSKSF